jgi:predicted DNA-binding transcriptional regulator YafY
LPARDAAAYVEQSITGVPTRYEARVTLHAPAEHFAGHVPSYWGTIEAKNERTCEFRAGDDDLGWLARRIAILGVDFDVHEPPELAEHLRELAGRLMRAAGPSA